MGAQGSNTIDFGVFPGASDTFKDITVASVLTTSAVEAWLQLADTADHKADEHMLETIKVFATCTVNGTIRVYGINTSQLNEPANENSQADRYKGLNNQGATLALNTSNRQGTFGGMGTRIYGLWSIWWVWN